MSKRDLGLWHKALLRRFEMSDKKDPDLVDYMFFADWLLELRAVDFMNPTWRSVA